MKQTVLVTGSTGYVGSLLVPHLLERGYAVKVLVREASRVLGRTWGGKVEIVEGNILDQTCLPPAFANVDIAYYLVHSMHANEDFAKRDSQMAALFASEAKAAGVKRIIYLGGLGEPGPQLSKHLRSRHETGEALRQSGVPVTEFRSAVIVGAGSLSFEMIRYLTERIPIMICPKWVYTRIQPIAIEDVLAYLLESLRVPESLDQVIEIGGKDILTYGEMMMTYAKVRGLKRWLLPVPVLTPRLSSHWVHWITPVPSSIAKPLIEGLKNEVIVKHPQAPDFFPEIKPMGYEAAVTQALNMLDAGLIESTWADAVFSSTQDHQPVLLTTREGMIIERRQISIQSSSAEVYREFSSLGGKKGWLYMDWAWDLRGFIDRLVGGVGMRRGRRHPQKLRTGDPLDFWRVEEIVPKTSVRLRAEMIVPGKAWLEFKVSPGLRGTTQLIQTAYFAPKGIPGLLYWYLLYPLHSLIFSGLIKQIARRAA